MKFNYLIYFIFLFYTNIFHSAKLDIYPSMSIKEIQLLLNNKNNSDFIFHKGTYFFKKNDKLKIRRNNINLFAENNTTLIFSENKNPSSYFIDIDTSKNVCISNFIFDGNNIPTFYGIKITHQSKKIKLINNSFINFFNNNGQCYVLAIKAINLKNIEIKNNIFKNISSLGDGKVGTIKGMCGAIYFYTDNTDSNKNYYSTGIIKGNIFDSIYLNKSNGNIDYDADAIRFYIPNNNVNKINSKGPTTFMIENNQFIDVEKSAIKIQSYPFIKITNNLIKSELRNLSMLAGIRIYGKKTATIGIRIDQLLIFGNIERGIIINGSKIKIKNVEMTTSRGSFPFFQIGYQDSTKNIQIKNVKSNKCNFIFLISENCNNISWKKINKTTFTQNVYFIDSLQNYYITKKGNKSKIAKVRIKEKKRYN